MRSIKKILGDGNCMFRALSRIVTGSQDQHSVICAKIVRHMCDEAPLMLAHIVALPRFPTLVTLMVLLLLISQRMIPNLKSLTLQNLIQVVKIIQSQTNTLILLCPRLHLQHVWQLKELLGKCGVNTGSTVLISSGKQINVLSLAYLTMDQAACKEVALMSC